MSKPWDGIGIGAWAVEADRAAEEQAAAANVERFPSLKEAASNAKSKKKKKKKKVMTLSEFISGGSRSSVGLTQQEILQLPTGPRQRSEDEMQPGRLGGGGFSSYGGRSGGMGRDRDDNGGSWGVDDNPRNFQGGIKERGFFSNRPSSRKGW